MLCNFDAIARERSKSLFLLVALISVNNALKGGASAPRVLGDRSLFEPPLPQFFMYTLLITFLFKKS